MELSVLIPKCGLTFGCAIFQTIIIFLFLNQQILAKPMRTRSQLSPLCPDTILWFYPFSIRKEERIGQIFKVWTHFWRVLYIFHKNWFIFRQDTRQLANIWISFAGICKSLFFLISAQRLANIWVSICRYLQISFSFQLQPRGQQISGFLFAGICKSLFLFISTLVGVCKYLDFYLQVYTNLFSFVFQPRGLQISGFLLRCIYKSLFLFISAQRFANILISFTNSYYCSG